ncbi:hypothetical protein N9C35_03975 [Flavobacteriaceae bacterium]|nr:hypothetical protein [Flavobacteriaceae bacterium]
MEEFFKNYQFTFSAIGAISTMLAVSTALWLSLREEKVLLGTLCKIVQNYNQDGSLEDFLVIEIINLGYKPIYISSNGFNIRFLFSNKGTIKLVPKFGNLPEDENNKILNPHQRKVVTIATKQEVRDILLKVKKDINCLSFHLPTIEVVCDNQTKVRAKSSKKCLNKILKNK